MKREILRAGDRGVLVELGSVSGTTLHAAAQDVRQLGRVRVVIPGQQSLLVIFDGLSRPEEVENAIRSIEPSAITGDLHEIRVSFATPHALDLDPLLQRAGLSRPHFFSQLEDLPLVARYLGFRAGFAYLDGWPESWSLPRRTTSRNLVPSGSFAVAGTMAGFYPIDTPGGWNVLGRTDATLWDPRREPPNLIAPGDRVRIVSTDEEVLPSMPANWPQQAGGAGSTIEVVSPGQLTLVVAARDWSRTQYGLPAGGPFDAVAFARANQAVGNDPFAPALECVLVGPRLRFLQQRRVAWCDGEGRVELKTVQEGEEYDIGRFRGGFRGYLAIEGGLHDMRAPFAEAPVQLRAGARLGFRQQHSSESHDAEADANGSPRGDRLTIRILSGPHPAPPLPQEWTVTSQMNRIGIRLAPAHEIAVALPANLPSCGMQFGTLQWHPDGSLMAMGPDHPVTGGYLQPATVVSDDLWKLGQLAPGDRVRFVEHVG